MGAAEELETTAQRRAALAKEKENFKAAIAEFGARPMLLDNQRLSRPGERSWPGSGTAWSISEPRALELPKSIGELRQRLEDNFQRLAIDSPEFGDLMRQLVPEFFVYLVRLVDGGHPLPRAKVKLILAGIVADSQLVPGLGELLTRRLTLEPVREAAAAGADPRGSR